MSRRFRPFYVAAIAVIMVGLFGVGVVPRSQHEPAQSTSTIASEDDSGWLGPQVKAPTDLLDLTTTLSILPFDIR